MFMSIMTGALLAQAQGGAKTSNPSIFNASTSTIRYYVKNNDALTATIYADYDAPATTNRGNIASGANTSTIDTGIPTLFGGSITVYAKAQATGKSESDVISLYIEV